jgi:RNA polymerase sigma factor (sigma-70 family)
LKTLPQRKPGSSNLLEGAFDRYYPALFRYFRFRGADAGTANDMAASVFERALAHIDTYDPHKAQIQTWLFAIAHNLAINHWKSRKASVSLDEELPDQHSLLEEVAIDSQDKEQVLAALRALDARSREIIALKFSRELTNREIAALTGLTESNVGVILYRSLAKLRVLLGDLQAEAYHDG